MKVHETETVAIENLTPHPKNYRGHPEKQIKHLMKSIQEHGFYRNIAVARDYTILAGHGVVTAATKLGLEEVPVVRLDLDPFDPLALKILAGDNEVTNLAHDDNRVLIEILNLVKEAETVDGLLGTGHDDGTLAILMASAMPPQDDFDAAAEWQGMPEFIQEAQKSFKSMLIHFDSEESMQKFAELTELKITMKTKSSWWPAAEKASVADKRVVSTKPEPEPSSG